MVAVLMAVIYKEKLTKSTIAAIVLSLIGILMLYQGGPGANVSALGMLLVILSSLTYAIYIIVVNKSPIRMSSIKLTFYALIVCAAAMAVFSFVRDGGVQMIPTTRSLVCAIGLALFPTVISLVMLAVAVNYVGSTPAAIMGALEPVTAVVIGVSVFNETLTPRLTAGMLLIMLAVMLIVVGKKNSTHHILAYIGNVRKKISKHWRWK